MPFTKGHTFYNHPNSIKTRFQKGGAGHLGFRHSEISNEKNRLAHLGENTGENNGSWKGGITPFLNKLKRLTEYKGWQKKVFERDNYTCRDCQRRGGLTLTPHHLTSFSFLVQILSIKTIQQAKDEIGLWGIRNGVTLCRECHQKTPNFSWRASKMPRDRKFYPIIGMFILFLVFTFPSFSEAATFGYTSIGGSGSTNRYWLGSNATAPENGTITSITVYEVYTENFNSNVGIYNWNNTTHKPSTHIAHNTSAAQTATGWHTFTVSASITSATQYALIGQQSIQGAGKNGWKFDTGKAATDYLVGENDDGFVYDTWADNPTASTFANILVSIYATYTATAAASNPKIQLKSSVQFKSNVQLK